MGTGIQISASVENGKVSFNISDSISSFRTERPDKGKNIIAFPDTYCVVDIETTGLSTSYDSIIEIAGLKIDSGKVVDTFSSLLKPNFEPCDGIYIDEFITDLTGITNEMLASAPETSDVIARFCDFLGDSVIIGHNANFDINFLYDDFMYHLSRPLTNDFIDTMRIARKLHSELPHHRLSDVANLYNIDYSSAHRALSDCEITNSCYLKLREDVLKKYESLEYFIKNFRYHAKAKDIHATTQDFDESNMLYQKVVVFTGKLEKMDRKKAMQIVADLGGINGDNVTQKTNYLILGNNDYCSAIKDGKSSKHKKAEKLKLQGYDIEVIPESVFYDMISDSAKY
ncbi:MAG: exonuclease [Lachnospiraceae bacterium]|nr:exonuclease [Lachnospiraceae bacterium]